MYMIKRKNIIGRTVFLCSLMYVASNTHGKNSELYLDSSQPIEKRVVDLLARMTLEEKVAQLQTIWHQGRELDKGFDAKKNTANGEFDASQAKRIMPLGIGQIARPSEFKDPLQTVKYTNAIQRWLINETRLGIPTIFHEEALHGHAAPQSTSFPQAIALASTWDDELIKEVYLASAKEVRARGGNQALTPILDVARDPRWGRIEETMGEDPYLIAQLGVAAVKGFQGDGDTIPQDRVIATLKHLTGHGQPSGGMNIAPAHIGERELREVFLYPFEAAVTLANVRSIMASYNEIDGIPSHANKMLLTDILRKEWGFNGLLVSDYNAIAELLTRHQLGGSKEDVAMMALNAGVDVEMPDPDVYPLLTSLVKQNRLDVKLIDISVTRILREKFNLGLFESPYTSEAGVNQFIGNDKHRALALKTAEKAMVLLKNDGTLPLNINDFKKIAVIGPHSDETLLGGYSDVPRQTVPILNGIREKLKGKAEVRFAKGARITQDIQDPTTLAIKASTYSKQRWEQNDASLAGQDDSQRLIDEAVKLTLDSDVAILVVGSNEATSREAWSEDHLGDRTSLNLLGSQEALIEAILATGKPTVLVMTNGRPLTLGKLYDKAPAIIEAWYLGQETGTAVANVLFGDVNPSGKLPLTFVRDVGQIPLYYNYRPSAKRGYLHGDTSAQFPFGHGLSYTSFKYSNLTIDDSKAQANGVIKARLSITNTGQYDGEEVVQFYVRDKFASVTRPVKQLKGFKRVALKTGESAKLEFSLPVNMLAFYDAQMQFIVEPGDIELMVGSSSKDIRQSLVFKVSGDTSVIHQEQKAYLSQVQIF